MLKDNFYILQHVHVSGSIPVPGGSGSSQCSPSVGVSWSRSCEWSASDQWCSSPRSVSVPRSPAPGSCWSPCSGAGAEWSSSSQLLCGQHWLRPGHWSPANIVPWSRYPAPAWSVPSSGTCCWSAPLPSRSSSSHDQGSQTRS